MRIAVLSGGVGGARFLRGVRAWAAANDPDADITAIVNTGDDMWLTGLRIAPDLDSIMYTLAGENDEIRGWGRIGETERVSAELRAYGVGWPWFTLGDLDLGTHITRSHYLRSGIPLSEATRLICSRWDLGVRLLPVTDDEVETYVVVDAADGAEPLHFQEWWTRHRAALPALEFVQRGVDASSPAPGVLDAIAGADVILLAPSNPVVSIGTILGIPGIRSALAQAEAPIVGVSPIINGSVVRGMADACLTAIGVATAADAVALHYGGRDRGRQEGRHEGRQEGRREGPSGLAPSDELGGVRAMAGAENGAEIGAENVDGGAATSAAGILDAWLVDESDAALVPAVEAAGIRAAAAPLWLRDLDSSAAVAGAAIALALGNSRG